MSDVINVMKMICFMIDEFGVGCNYVLFGTMKVKYIDLECE